MVPSKAIFMLAPAFTPPKLVPEGGKSCKVPVVDIVPPVAGLPRPGPALTAVTVPTLLVESTPLEFTDRPGPTETTPRELVVATGKDTPGKVCEGLKVMTPVIVPPVFGNAALAVA